MSTEEDNKDVGADDPFAGWAEALEEQKRTDDKPGDGEQGGPLSGEPVRPFSGGGDGTVNDINMVLDIPVQLSVELDALAGEPMDVLVNGYLIAQGEVVVVNDKFGIRLTDVVTPSERLRRVAAGHGQESPPACRGCSFFAG